MSMEMIIEMNSGGLATTQIFFPFLLCQSSPAQNLLSF